MVTLVKDQCRLNIRKRTINEWNKLSTDCVTASSVNRLTHISGGNFTHRLKMLDSRKANGLVVHLPSGPLPWMATLSFLKWWCVLCGPWSYGFTCLWPVVMGWVWA